jgi:hypothetical protein
MERIKEHQERISNNNQNKSITQQFRAALTAGPVIKPLGISLGVMLFQQTTGINAIIFYTVSIFQTAGSTIESRYATIIVGAVQLIFTLASGFLVISILNHRGPIQFNPNYYRWIVAEGGYFLSLPL